MWRAKYSKNEVSTWLSAIKASMDTQCHRGAVSASECKTLKGNFQKLSEMGLPLELRGSIVQTIFWELNASPPWPNRLFETAQRHCGILPGEVADIVISALTETIDSGSIDSETEDIVIHHILKACIEYSEDDKRPEIELIFQTFGGRGKLQSELQGLFSKLNP